VSENCFVVGAILFALGALGFLTRRNLIVLMLSAELMLHGVSLNFVSSSAKHGNYEGQSFTVFVLTVAACEAGLALALLLTLYRRRKSLDVGLWSTLGEPGTTNVDPSETAATTGIPDAAPPDAHRPRLTPAGLVPFPQIEDGPLQNGRPQKVSPERV
jgi:NADH-quinone oxidoreductase subunit K